MKLKELVETMVEKPYVIRMGRGKLAARYNSTPEEIDAARVEAKAILDEKGVDYHTHRPQNYDTKKFPKILIFDTETAPMRAYVWNRWKQNISLDATISEWFMLCWSAKWLYSGEILGDRLTGKEAKAEDDSRIMKSLWKLIDEADIVIAHNAKKSDIPWMNARFVVNNLLPPKPYIVVDTLEVAKKNFGFSSNKLDALAGYFKIPHKMDTDFKLWKRCCDGEEDALEYMSEYNKKDTAILELVYLKLRPWVKGGPNISVFFDDDSLVCSTCGSEDLEELTGQYYYTSVNKYPLYRCKNCGAITRGRKSIKTARPSGVSCGH